MEENQKYIIVKGARVHNLKNISVELPRNKLVVVTGVSGSGKSSLVFDTIYAEGHRRYIESLSAYTRQFFTKLNKPDVDIVAGISPAIAIEQKVSTSNPRSTVATSIEIYDYLKILFARAGKTVSPVSGREVKKHSTEDVVNHIISFPEGTSVFIYGNLDASQHRDFKKLLANLLAKGFTRIKYAQAIHEIERIRDAGLPEDGAHVLLLVDRVTINQNNEELKSRLYDSVETAFYEGNGECIAEYLVPEGNKHAKKEISMLFSNRFESDGIRFEEPSPQLFSFNSPYGACRKCEGFGQIIGIDEDLVIPDKNLSVFSGAVACWKGEKMGEWWKELVDTARLSGFPIHKPYYQLTEEQKKLLWTGNKYFGGLNKFFEYVESQTYKIQYRVMLARYRGKTKCRECNGSRLRMDALYVRFGSKTIHDIVSMPVSAALSFFMNLPLSGYEKKIAGRLLFEIISRLRVLDDIGLGYLTLDRPSNTLSGGESQRINLARSIGSPLVGSLYILDEPSIGLHQRDTMRLMKVLQRLRNGGNTVIVVEHDEAVIRNADHIIDLGPGAGSNGGEVVFSGNFEQMLKEGKSLTGDYFRNTELIPVPEKRRKWRDFIEILEARHHNLKGINVKIPLQVLTVITGVSGSGKSTLIRDILYPALRKFHGLYGEKEGIFGGLSGDVQRIKQVEMVNQNPIGCSSRSNPVTYIKAYDEVRALFASLPAAKIAGSTPAHFSFNVDGGRCDACQGEGEIVIEMQFLSDVHLTCDECKGKRFRNEILDIKYRGKNIADILNMTVDEAIDFFGAEPEKALAGNHYVPARKDVLHRAGYRDTDASQVKAGLTVANKLKCLQEVGLGYVKLGQPAGTLSGGEAQRVKLASFIGQGGVEPILFLFDEPTTGLHFYDIKKLLAAFGKLLEKGHSIVVIEHNPEIIKCADWLIDLGPEGGEEGGHIVFEGMPGGIVKCEKSYTGQALRQKMQS